MFWSLILPFQITCGVLALAVITLTVLAKPGFWNRLRALVGYLLLANVAFIPTCLIVGMIVDAFRFREFAYASFSDVPGERWQRYLPEAATSIRMQAGGNGYHARYTISEKDFHEYLDRLWKKYGQYSAFPRGSFHEEGERVPQAAFHGEFGRTGWSYSPDLILYYGPHEDDGGGARYYFDAKSGLMFQRMVIW